MEPNELTAIFNLVKEMAGIECVTINQLSDWIKKIVTENQTRNNQVTTLETQLKDLQPHKDLNEKILTGLRNDVEKYTRLTRGTGDNKSIGDMEIQLIQNASYDQLILWQKERKHEFENQIPMKCSNCGSTSVERRSSLETPVISPDENTYPNRSGFKTIELN